MQVFKEEEEAIKVDLHEGCGRIKLFWIMALADSKTLKAMIEFREGKGKCTITSIVSIQIKTDSQHVRQKLFGIVKWKKSITGNE